MVPRVETALGAINGVNTSFFSLVPYTPGTTAVFLNGDLLEPLLDNGWLETSAALGLFTMKEAPRTGDVVRIYYLDTTAGGVIVLEEVCGIVGVLVEVDELDGLLADTDQLQGSIVICETP